jgi:hypothetical protein
VGDSVGLLATVAGLEAAGDVGRPANGRDLVSLWKGRFSGRARDMLELLAATAEPLTREQIASSVSLDVEGGTFRTYMSQLRSAGLVLRTRGGFQIAPELRL